MPLRGYRKINRRIENLQIKLTVEEKENLMRYAQDNGLSISEAVREAIRQVYPNPYEQEKEDVENFMFDCLGM